MISKVSGKRFTYKFDCDLKLLIGYTTAELCALLNEKWFVDENVYSEHMDNKTEEEWHWVKVKEEPLFTLYKELIVKSKSELQPD